MLRILILLVWVATLGACVDRSVSVILPQALEVGTAQTVFAATTRAREPDGSYGYRRAEDLSFLEMTVSIPPNHTPGTLGFSYADPNPNKQFVLAGVAELPSPRDLKARLNGVQEVTIFVHGYNSTQTETAFRAAQLAYDIGLPGQTLIYSWPSRGSGTGYAYDLDSMLFARDGLERTVRTLKSIGVKRVLIVAHSMGSALTMEMLRQTELREPGWARRNLEGVLLISPDLDVDVFRAQMASIKTPPDPFLLMVSKKDRILGFSARLRGTAEGERLGNIQTTEKLAEYPISIIDMTAFNSDAESSHFVAATSPALVSLLGSLRRVNETFGRGKAGVSQLIPPAASRKTGATEVVLTETGQVQVRSQ